LARDHSIQRAACYSESEFTAKHAIRRQTHAGVEISVAMWRQEPRISCRPRISNHTASGEVSSIQGEKFSAHSTSSDALPGACSAHNILLQRRNVSCSRSEQ